MSYQPPPPGPPGPPPPGPPPGYPPSGYPPQSVPGPPPPEPPYPLRFDVEYPDRDLDRLSTALRFLWIIPIAILLASFDPTNFYYDYYGASYGGLLVVPAALMIIFREKYPRWWFDFNRNLTAFSTRVAAYALLMSDQYPSTDDEQYVWLEIDYPDVPNELNRWMPLVKWLLAIPHYFVLFFLGIGAFFALIYAWFAILFTGRYPRDVFDFIVGVVRWYMCVAAYAALLVTDRYPPFKLSA